MKKKVIYIALILGLYVCTFKAYSQDPKEKIKNNLIGTWVLNDDASIKIVYDSNNNKKIYQLNFLIDSSTYIISETCENETLTNGRYFIKSTDTEDSDISCEVIMALSSRNNITTLSLSYDGHMQLLTKQSQSYSNTALTTPFKKNNCGTGEGESFDYTVAAGTYSSAVSQTDADNQAKADVAKNGQKYANEALGGCIYYNVALTKQFNKFPCPKGSIGSLISYTVPARTFNSELSQADADLMAEIRWKYATQAGANFAGKCLFGNVAVTKNFTKMGCTGVKKGTVVPYTVKAGTYTAEKQGDADKLAQDDMVKNGQNNANNKGQCK